MIMICQSNKFHVPSPRFFSQKTGTARYRDISAVSVHFKPSEANFWVANVAMANPGDHIFFSMTFVLTPRFRVWQHQQCWLAASWRTWCDDKYVASTGCWACKMRWNIIGVRVQIGWLEFWVLGAGDRQQPWNGFRLSISRVFSFISYIFPIRLARSFRWLRGRIAAKAVLPLEPEHAFLEWERAGNKAGLEVHSDKSLAKHAIAVIPTSVCGSWDGSTAWYAALSGSDIYS